MLHIAPIWKKEQRILAQPAKNLRKTFYEETVQKVKSFYWFSCICPGKKEYVPVKTEDSKNSWTENANAC